MSNATPNPDASDVFPHGPGTPMYQPLERFWPYADLPEQPTREELAALDPDLHAGAVRRAAAAVLDLARLSAFELPDFARALELARASAEYRETGQRRRAALPRAVLLAGCRALARSVRDRRRLRCHEVLIDDRPVPYARELWLPLVWC